MKSSGSDRFTVATLAVVSSIGLLALVAPASAQDGSKPWWDDWPLITQDDCGGENVSEMQALHATVSYNCSLAGLEGPYGQKVANYPWVSQEIQAAGLKSISSIEAFGQSSTFVGELGSFNGELTPFAHSPIYGYENWRNYGGGPVVWAGAHSFFDDEAFARPFTRTHPRYGGAPMRYPDGTIATGYLGDPPSPLNSRVLDAGCAKSILGQIPIEVVPVAAEIQQNGPHDGLLNFAGVYSAMVLFSKDSACPMWAELDAAATKLGADQGLDGWYTDNYSAWDSFLASPVAVAFGDWSVALFRGYLATHFTASELNAMGVPDPSTFDIRAALRAQALAWGGNDADLSDPTWQDARWTDHPLWRAYVIFKRQKGTEGLANRYDRVKAAALDAGKPEFLVQGNDIAAASLGWVRGDLDMVNTELSAGPHPWSTRGPRGFLLPPVGRYSPEYKLAREHAKGRFVCTWPLLTGSDLQYVARPGIATVVLYEALASHALPMANPGHAAYSGTFMGTMASHAQFFEFVTSAKALLADRTPENDIGIYYSTSSLLAFMTPGGWVDPGRQQHAFAAYGWGTALGELHHQYRFVPEWKLSSQTLSELRILIIPDAEVFDPADVPVLQAWVSGGGRLIVTGNSGLRLGEPGNFEHNPTGLSLAPLTGVSSMTPPPAQRLQTVGAGKVLYLPDNIGMEYYNEDGQRNALRSKFTSAMNLVTGGTASLLVNAPAVPTTVGITLYSDEPAERLFVDVNNFNINLATDAIQPAGPMTFDVALPAWLDPARLRVATLSPDGAGVVTLGTGTPGRVTITLNSLTYYTSIVLFDSANDSGRVPRRRLRRSA